MLKKYYKILILFCVFSISLSIFSNLNIKKVYASSNNYNYIRYLPLKEQLKFDDSILKQVYPIKETRVAIIDDILYYALGVLVTAWGVAFINDFQSKEIGRAIWWEFRRLGGVIGDIISDVGDFLTTHTVNITTTLRNAINNVIDSYSESSDHTYSESTEVSESVGSTVSVTGNLVDNQAYDDYFDGQVVYVSSIASTSATVKFLRVLSNGGIGDKFEVSIPVNCYFQVVIRKLSNGKLHHVFEVYYQNGNLYNKVTMTYGLDVIQTYSQTIRIEIVEGIFSGTGTSYNSIVVPPVQVGDFVKDDTILKPGTTVTIPNEETVKENLGTLTPDNTLTWDNVGVTVDDSLVSDDTITGDITGTITGTVDGIFDNTVKKTIDFSPLYLSFSDKFPFCLPFDFYNIISEFKAEVKEPVFYVDMSSFSMNKTVKGNVGFEIDFTKFETLFSILRVFILISFISFLIIKTRDIIKG